MKLRSLLRAVGILAVSSLLVIPMAQSSAQGATKNTYKLIWSDEFNRKAGWGPDLTKWTYDTMLGPNSEKQYYTTSRLNSQHDGKGNMVITSRLITIQHRMPAISAGRRIHMLAVLTFANSASTS